jgi:hypothetical protein
MRGGLHGSCWARWAAVLLIECANVAGLFVARGGRENARWRCGWRWGRAAGGWFGRG